MCKLTENLDAARSCTQVGAARIISLQIEGANGPWGGLVLGVAPPQHPGGGCHPFRVTGAARRPPPGSTYLRARFCLTPT